MFVYFSREGWDKTPEVFMGCLDTTIEKVDERQVFLRADVLSQAEAEEQKKSAWKGMSAGVIKILARL